MRQTMFAFESEDVGELNLPLEAGQTQRLIELMAQAIEAVLQDTQSGEQGDRL